MKIISLLLCFLLVFEQSGFAQIGGQGNIPGPAGNVRGAVAQDRFRPMHLRYLSYDTANNNFRLLLDTGDLKEVQAPRVQEETQALLKYFFTGVSLPNGSFWVNLRPDSPDRMIDSYLAQTDVGKILLEADLLLKKDAARLTSPENPAGRRYWDLLYKKAGELFGEDSLTIPAFTRPWIVPDEIIVREAGDNAYIYKATLKVRLEQDHLKGRDAFNFEDGRMKELNEYSSRLMRELIIPGLTKEVNSSKRYASLRQVYYSLVLAQWFKGKFAGRGGVYSSIIDSGNLNGLVSKERWSKDIYFKEYQRSFREGEYNIREQAAVSFGQIIKTYCSGGIDFGLGAPGISGGAIGQALQRGLVRTAVPVDALAGNKHVIMLRVKKGGSLDDLAVDGGQIQEVSMSEDDRAEWVAGSGGDGFIQSKQGTAVEELKRMRVEERDKFSRAVFPDEQVIEYIKKMSGTLAQRAAAPKTEWEKENLPKYAALAQEALARIVRLRESGKIFSFKALVYGKEDYALGFGNDDEMGLAEELLGMDTPLLAEYLFHEALCFKVEHRQAKYIQEYVFFDNYPQEGKKMVQRLRARLRGFIDTRARTMNGVDLLGVMEKALQEHEGVAPVFTDMSDYSRDQDYPGAFSFQTEWYEKVKDLMREKDVFVFYGAFESLRMVGNCTSYRDARELYKDNFKIALNENVGIVGVTDVPPEISAAIREALQGSNRTELMEVSRFAVIVNLHRAGYAQALVVLRNYLNNRSPLCSFEEFESMLEIFGKHSAEYSKKRENSDDFEKYGFDRSYTQMKNEGEYLKELFWMLRPKDLHSHLKRHLLKYMQDKSTPLYVLKEIWGEKISFKEKDLVDLLWDMYLDESNTSDENSFFLRTLVRFLNQESGSRKEALFMIRKILEKKDLNNTTKALDVLFRINISKDSQDRLAGLLDVVHYKKDLLASFVLVNGILFLAKEKLLNRGSYYSRDKGVTEAITADNRGIYYYLLRIEENRKKSGAMKSDADQRIVYYTIQLDNRSSFPGEFGRSGFTWLRDRIHRHASSHDLEVVAGMIKFWLGDGVLIPASDIDKGIFDFLSKDFKSAVSGSYSLILKNTAKKLREKGRIASADADPENFLKEILNIPEGEVLAILEEANPQADEDNRNKMKYLVGLYYALSERYGMVWGTVIPGIKGEKGQDEWEREYHKAQMMRLVYFMKEDYQKLIAVIDSDRYAEILTGLAQCRWRIRRRLLFEKIEEGIDTEFTPQELLLELDHNMFLLGRDMIVKVMDQMNESRSLEDLKKHKAALAGMGRFMLASGLGGVEFEQLVYELENNNYLTYSQLHDLTRALRTEIHKTTRKISDNAHLSMAHIWDGFDFSELKEEWQRKLDDLRKTERWRSTLTDEEKGLLEQQIIDTLIENTALMSFDSSLMKFNDILEAQLTPDNDRPVDKQEPAPEPVIEEQFLRFGQPDVIPREGFLSLWSKKGLNLVKMTEEDIAVPPGVILSAKLCTNPRIFKSAEFREQVMREIELIRKYSRYPDLKLLLYARSGSAFTLPGLLVTIHNLGMNDTEAAELEKLTGDTWFAYDTYAEFIRSFAINILGIPEIKFQEAFNIYEKDNISGEEMKDVCRRYKEIVALHGRGQKIPEAMIDQVMLAIDCVYDSWDSPDAREYRLRHRISPEWGTVVILQKGVFGNLSPTREGRISGTGAAALRILPDGREVIQGKFRFRSIGEQLMSRADQNYLLLSHTEKVSENEQTLQGLQPEVYNKILDYAHQLKNIFGNNQHFEFTVELNKVWINQTNDDLVIDDYPEFVEPEGNPFIARGHGVSGGALRGWVANSFESAERLLAKYNTEKPEGVDGVILFLNRVSPELINRIPKGVHLVARIISVHAETIAQISGITAVYGVSDMEYNQPEGAWYIGGKKMEDGQVISIDGHENQLLYHNSGNIYLGSLPIAEPSGARVEVERRSPRALEVMRDLVDQEQWRKAMEKRDQRLTPYELEVLSAFQKVREGQLGEGEIMRYLMNYRALLDKIAAYCKDMNFDLYGEVFRKTLVEKLSALGIDFELFINLNRHYHPRSDASRLILDDINIHLQEKPAEKQSLPDIVCVDDQGRETVLREDDLRHARIPPGKYFMLHKPRGSVKLVSFEVDGVLEKLVINSDAGRVAELFRALKSMGLKIAVTTSNPGGKEWIQEISRKYPEISKSVDYCYVDFRITPFLKYTGEHGFKPEEIIHFDNWLYYDVTGLESHAARLHEMGMVSVMIGDPVMTNIWFRTTDIMEKSVDVVMPELRDPDMVVDIVQEYLRAGGARVELSEGGAQEARDGGERAVVPGGSGEGAEGPGGIDFRSLPMRVSNTDIPGGKGYAAGSGGGEADPDWARIEYMVSAGTVPSGRQIREYARGCSRKKNPREAVSRVLNCIADIMRMQEEGVADPDRELQEVLVFLESGEPVNE